MLLQHLVQVQPAQQEPLELPEQQEPLELPEQQEPLLEVLEGNSQRELHL